MQSNNLKLNRRHFLTATATVVGGSGVVATAIPFISAFSPSAKTKALGGPVEVDLRGMQAGDRQIVKWRGRPVWIVRRSPESLQDMTNMIEQLKDPQSEQQSQPEYAHNEHRSIRPEYLVVIGICTHFGCSPSYRTKENSDNLGADWKGGFFCPCHASKFDLAGRVFKGVPAPTNLVVPPHRFLSETRILIGEDSEVNA